MLRTVSIAALVAATNAAHAVCAEAVVLANLVTANSTFSDANMVDPIFQTQCGADFYRDLYFKYTATCTGVGLISTTGGANKTDAMIGVFTGTCAAPVQQKVSSLENVYTDASMLAECTKPPTEGSSTEVVQNAQFMAVTGTEYIIAVGTFNAENMTGNGDSFFEITVGCAAPASNDPTAPTVVTTGVSAYSNVGGLSAGVRPSGCDSNAVYMEYTAPCTGTVVFSLVPPPCSGACDGFHGEDLKIGMYNGAMVDDDVCQDDPAYIYANATADATWSPPDGAKFNGGVVEGEVYIVTASSYSSDIAPFVLLISACDGESAGTSGATAVGVSVAALLACFL